MPELSGEDYISVDLFRGDMIVKLEENAHKYHWTKCTHTTLLSRIDRCSKELKAVLINQCSTDIIIRECADIANYAMMIADIARRRSQDANTTT